MNKVFRMPTPVKITGRTSSITNAFVNGIIPIMEPTEQEIDEVLDTLGMTRDTICCAYCGATYTEWDHFRPLVLDKRPTGYISEIHNLVPACGKCNQSKGNKDWKKWIYSEADFSPKSKGVKNLDERVKRLESYEKKYSPIIIDFEKIVGRELWSEHWNNHNRLITLMKEYQNISDEIRNRILSEITDASK